MSSVPNIQPVVKPPLADILARIGTNFRGGLTDHDRQMLREAADAMRDLVAACNEEVSWFDDLQANSHPDDARLQSERKRIHGPRIDRARAAIAKARSVSQ